MIQDIPSPIDLRLMQDAREWESTALSKRPHRVEFFAAFAKAIREATGPANRVLELGSGPGFLADHLLDTLPGISYVALDFSPAMHALAAARIGSQASRVQFVERSFKASDWTKDMGLFDVVVTNQAVHELRHKRHAQLLHEQVREVLSAGGSYLVCDHFAGEGGMKNDQLFMTVSEQSQALLSAGFARVEQLLCKGSMVLHRAT